MAGVKNNPIAGLQWRLKPRKNAAAADAPDFAQIDAALFSEPGMNQALVVDSAEPPRVKPAGECHLQVVARLVARRAGIVQSVPINPRDVGNVFRRFEAAFDFER